LRKDQPEHLQILESILQGEQHWRAWKKTKCKASAFAPQYGNNNNDQESPNKKKRRMLLDGPLGDDDDENQQDHQQGHDFTLMDADELATISKSMVEAVPTLDQHLEPYVDALDPDAGIEAEYHPKNDPIFSWRAMRLYTKHQLPLLHMCSKSGDFERMTRKYYQDKGKEIPGIMPGASDEGSVSSEESKAEEEEPKVEKDEPAPEPEKEEHHSKAAEVAEEEEDVAMEPVDKYKEGAAAYEAEDGEEDSDDEEPIETLKIWKRSL
jgi:THO complex subunit 1